MNRRALIIAAAIVAVLLVTTAPAFQDPPEHAGGMDDAIAHIRGARDRLQQEEQQLANGSDPDRLREVQRRKANLDAILNALATAEIKWDYPIHPTDDPIAIAEDYRTPQRIRVDETRREIMSSEALAQHLAHEAVHLIIRNREKSIDEEYRAYLKEAEVWEELKRANPNLTDQDCDANLALIQRGEAVTKANLRGRYRGVPEMSRSQ